MRRIRRLPGHSAHRRMGADKRPYRLRTVYGRRIRPHTIQPLQLGNRSGRVLHLQALPLPDQAVAAPQHHRGHADRRTVRRKIVYVQPGQTRRYPRPRITPALYLGHVFSLAGQRRQLLRADPKEDR